MDVAERIHLAKQLARPQLSPEEWSRRSFATSLSLDRDEVLDTMERVDGRQLSVDHFMQSYGSCSQPCVITHLTNSWAAETDWTPEKLCERCVDGQWRVGCSEEGKAVQITLADFFHYCAGQAGALQDDSPLYVFDWDFSEDPQLSAMLGDYSVPEYFRDDLFELLDHLGCRPPHRWMIMGPARSGSTLHTDPLSTSAWNTLLVGHKKWILFPPDTAAADVLPTDLLPDSKELGGAAQWFANVLPRAQHAVDWPTHRPIEVLQKPGETMYVPAGWWHAVLNLDTTIAVTQNFAQPHNFDDVWRSMVEGRGDLIPEFYRKLELSRPDLAKRADDMGGIDEARKKLVEASADVGVGDLFSSLLEWPGEMDFSSSDSDTEQN